MRSFIQKSLSHYKTQIFRRFQKKYRWDDRMHVSGGICILMTASQVIFVLLTHINAIFDRIRNFRELKLTAMKSYQFLDMF